MMAVKKDESRFTIKFNPENPRHNKAIQILNNYGKGMSSLIADALCAYIQYEPESNSPHKKAEKVSPKKFSDTLNSALDMILK